MPQNPPSDLTLVARRLKSKTLVLYNTKDQENPCLIQYRGPIKSLSYTNQRSGKSLSYTMKGQENPGRIQYRSRSGKSLSFIQYRGLENPCLIQYRGLENPCLIQYRGLENPCLIQIRGLENRCLIQ